MKRKTGTLNALIDKHSTLKIKLNKRRLGRVIFCYNKSSSYGRGGGDRHWHAFQIDFETKLQIKRISYPGPLIWHPYVFINSKFSINQMFTPFGKNSFFNSAISVFGYEWNFVVRRFIKIGLGVQQEGKCKGTYTVLTVFFSIELKLK